MNSATKQLSLRISRITHGVWILLLTAVLFPLAVAVCLPCYLMTSVVKKKRRTDSPAPVGHGKCVLVLGGAKCKSLHVARLFKEEGYRTVLAENELYPCAAAGFSRHVDAFCCLPDPDSGPEKYKAAVMDVVHQYKPDILIPVDPRTVPLDIELFALLPENCFPLACDAETFKELDDKSLFMAALEKTGIPTARAHLINNWEEAYDVLKGKSRWFVYKPVVYDSVSRSNIFPPEDLQQLEQYLKESRVSKTRPYVIQERLVGPEMASVSLVMNGRILAQSVGFSSPVHQTQDQIDCPEVEAWVERFVRLYPRELVGWFTFDYMRSAADGKVYPLECNPRLGTNFMLFSHKQGIISLLQDAIDEARSSLGNKSCNGSKNNDPTNTVKRSIRTDGEEKENSPEDTISPTFHNSGSKSETKDASFIVPEDKQLFYLMNVIQTILSRPLSVATWKQYLTILFRGKEGVFSVWDPLPFLVLNFVQIPVLIVKYLVYNKPWNIADYNIGTLKMV